jgi:MFS family permease
VSSIAGPLIGGFITDSISWRWVFYLNLPIGLVAAFVVHRTLPARAQTSNATVDWQGGLLLFVSTTLLLVALSEVSLAWALLALASIVGFAYVEQRAPDPILPFVLFRNRIVAVATTIGFLAGMALFGTIAFVPLLVQLTTGGSATSAGQILTPLYLTWVLASIVAARMLLRVGARVSTVVGTAAVFLATVALPWLAVGSSRPSVFGDIALMGTGLGFAMLSLLLAVQHSVARSELGVATSLNLFARSIGGAVGVAIMGAILAAGVGESQLGPGALDTAGLVGLSPELKHRLIVSLQRAFTTGAVAAGLALVTSFWVPPFAGSVDANAEMLAAEIVPSEPEAEPSA